MLKKWPAVAIGALLAVSIVVVDDVEAEATAASISVDCATGQILAGQTFSAVVVGETITIVNGSSSDACTLSVATSVATVTGTAGTAPSLTLAASGTAVLTVVDSGTFTVADAGAVARTFVIDSCSLTGAGVESDPWRISSQADFRLIGDQTGTNSCVLGGHYLQTVDFVLNSWALDQVAGNFSGVYDGDHYTITLGAGNGSNDWDHETRTSGGPSGLFVAVVGGTVKKLQISGTIVSYEAAIGGVARETSAGAVISEVSSGVNITARYGAPVVGGIVGIFGSGNSRVQYSRSSGTIVFPTYSFPGSGLGKASIGGIVGYHAPAGAPQKAEIRDSYSRAVFDVDTTGISDGTGVTLEKLSVGGLLGSVDDSVGSAPTFYFIRNYAVTSLTDACVPVTCGTNVKLGELAGSDQSESVWVSNFYKAQAWSNTGDGGAILTLSNNNYDTSGNPESVPLADSLLKSMTTYQSAEASAGGDVPSGLADLSATSDYRWAIEQINVQTFVPSTYAASPSGVNLGSASEQNDYANRNLYPTAVPMATASYLRERLAGTTDLTDVSLSRGSDAATADDYPLLGRVWDICDDYPTLVWEESTSCTGSSGGSSGSSDSSSSASSNPGGLSDSEYVAFLASGLTLEQFLAARLAATGPDGALLVGGGSLTLLFLAAGAIILVALGRERRLRRSYRANVA